MPKCLYFCIALFSSTFIIVHFKIKKYNNGLYKESFYHFKTFRNSYMIVV